MVAIFLLVASSLSYRKYAPGPLIQRCDNEVKQTQAIRAEGD